MTKTSKSRGCLTLTVGPGTPAGILSQKPVLLATIEAILIQFLNGWGHSGLPELVTKTLIFSDFFCCYFTEKYITYMYLYMYLPNMCKRAQNFFFRGGGTRCGRWEGIPTIAMPNNFFNVAEWPQAPGVARGKLFPTIATPRWPLLRTRPTRGHEVQKLQKHYKNF